MYLITKLARVSVLYCLNTAYSLKFTTPSFAIVNVRILLNARTLMYLIRRHANALAPRRNNAMDTTNTSTKIPVNVNVVLNSSVKELRDLMKVHVHADVQVYPLVHQENI